MRMFALPVTLIVIAVLVYALYVMARGAISQRMVPPRWEIDTRMEDGWTLVILHKVVQDRGGLRELTKQTVAAIPDDDPNWDERYRAALAEARSRQSTLQLEAD